MIPRIRPRFYSISARRPKEGPLAHEGVVGDFIYLMDNVNSFFFFFGGWGLGFGIGTGAINLSPLK
jgi:hypothetical protein